MSEAFISYSRADSAFADKLSEDLEKRGIPVWIDRESIEGGAAWRASISKAIRSCCAFILILSPRSTQSGQVSKELSVAETHNRLIIPVVLEKCDIPPGMELQLAELQWISFAEHSYDAALERLTRVITEARSRTAGASTTVVRSPAGDAATTDVASRSGDASTTHVRSPSGNASTTHVRSPSGNVSTTHVPSPSGKASTTHVPSPSGGGLGWGWSSQNRKWLYAGGAAVLMAGASLAAFQLMQNQRANSRSEGTANSGTKGAVEAVATGADSTGSVVPTLVQPSTDAAGAEARTPESATITAPAAAIERAETRTSNRAAPATSAPSGSEGGATRAVPQQALVAQEKPAMVARADPKPEKSAVTRTDPAAAQASHSVVGNTRTLLYHFADCPGYSRIRPDARIEFSSAGEAERAGYKLSDNCSDPSGGRPAVAIIANSRTRAYFLPHCTGYAATRPENRVPFNSAAEAEKAGYKRSANCS